MTSYDTNVLSSRSTSSECRRPPFPSPVHFLSWASSRTTYIQVCSLGYEYEYEYVSGSMSWNLKRKVGSLEKEPRLENVGQNETGSRRHPKLIISTTYSTRPIRGMSTMVLSSFLFVTFQSRYKTQEVLFCNSMYTRQCPFYVSKGQSRTVDNHHM